MNIFKKLKRWLSKKQPREENPEWGMVQVIIEMPCNIVHPADLMEALLMAISYHTNEPAYSSVRDIRLYSLYDRKDSSFIGSFYALKHKRLFYGNIIGSPQVFSCTPEAFQFKESNMLFIPLENNDEKTLFLICKYNRDKASLKAVCLKKTDKFMQHEEILYKFPPKTSFNEAYTFYQQMSKSD